MRTFDVIVIGAGPAGEIAAGRLGERSDREVALVERELVGGECSYWACMPSKALLRPGELLDEIARVPGVADDAPARGPGAAAVLARRDEVIHGLSDEAQMPWLDRRGVTLLRGRAQEREAGRRRAAYRRSPAGRDRPPTAHRRPRFGRARAGARQADRGRRVDARGWAVVALRDRRRERPRAAHAHGQVPGARGGR